MAGRVRRLPRSCVRAGLSKDRCLSFGLDAKAGCQGDTGQQGRYSCCLDTKGANSQSPCGFCDPAGTVVGFLWQTGKECRCMSACLSSRLSVSAAAARFARTVCRCGRRTVRAGRPMPAACRRSAYRPIRRADSRSRLIKPAPGNREGGRHGDGCCLTSVRTGARFRRANGR